MSEEKEKEGLRQETEAAEAKTTEKTDGEISAEEKASEKEQTPAPEAAKKEDKRKEEKRKGKRPSVEEEKLAALEEEKLAMNDRYLRICAEYDNFRRRSQKEKDALYGDIRADVVAKFLPVYDNLERALKQGTEDEAYRKGVEMIMTQFCTTLEKLGVEEVPCLGQKFDPTLHNAVMHVDDAEKGENEIVEVFQKGFKLNDKVIRFAMVKVAN